MIKQIKKILLALILVPCLVLAACSVVVDDIKTPGVVTNLVATAGNAQVTITWGAPLSDGGAPIVGYEVTDDNWASAIAKTAGQASHTFTDLTNGEEYEFKVRVVNSRGAGTASTVKATPTDASATVPGAVATFIAQAGDTEVTVSWTAGNDGGAAITKYEVTKDNWATKVDKGSADRSHKFEGLTNDVLHTFKIRAVNSEGTGEEKSVTATPVAADTTTVPGVVATFTAVAGNGQVALSWTAPSDTGGLDITGYHVTRNDWVSHVEKTAIEFEHTFGELTNGTQYTFKIRALNSKGLGAERTATATPVDTTEVPSEVSNLDATSIDAAVTLTWNEPLDNGGSNITGYEVTRDDWVTTIPLAETVFTYTFTSLTYGEEYEFKVRAVNAKGAGAEISIIRAPLDPRTAPSDVLNLQATPGDRTVTITWTQPTNSGGADITGYKIMTNDNESTIVTKLPTEFTHTFNGLTNDTEYEFKVWATNAKGAGTSSSVSATPVDLSAPTAPTFAINDTGNTVTIEAIANGEYRWRYKGETNWSTVATANTFTVNTGITQDVSYEAQRRVLGGEWSPVGTFDHPKYTITYNANGGTGTILNQTKYHGWNNPIHLSDGTGFTRSGYTLTSWGVTYSLGQEVTANIVGGLSLSATWVQNSMAWNPTLVLTDGVGGESYSQSLTPLATGADQTFTYSLMTGNLGGLELSQNGTLSGTLNNVGAEATLQFTVRALSSNGASVTSGTFTLKVVPGATVPGAVTNFSADAGDEQVMLSWNPPSNNGGAGITGYEITYDDWDTKVLYEVPSDITYLFYGFYGMLENGVTYEFKIRAVNAKGSGTIASVFATPVAPDTTTVPGNVSSFTAQAGDAQVTLNWGVPANTGGLPILGYEVTKSTDGWAGAVSTTALTHTFTGLTNGTQYTFWVRALNSKGDGPMSSVSSTPVAPEPQFKDLNDFLVLILDNYGDYSATGTYTEREWENSSWLSDVYNGEATYKVYNDLSYMDETQWENDDILDVWQRSVYQEITNGESVTRYSSQDEGVSWQVSRWTTSQPENLFLWDYIEAFIAVQEALYNGQFTRNGNVYTLNGEAHYDYTEENGVITYSWTVRSCVIEINEVEVKATMSVAHIDYEDGEIDYIFQTDSVLNITLGGAEFEIPQEVRDAVIIVPSSVENFAANAGDGQVTLTWGDPYDDGGSDITGYEVTMDNWTTIVTKLPTEFSHTFTGLTNGTQYTFRVRAVNIKGAGSSSTLNATPLAPASSVPGPVANLRTINGEVEGAVGIAWSPPENNGGLPVTAYHVSMDNWTTFLSYAANVTITNLSSYQGETLVIGQEYTFYVRAVNALGNGESTSVTGTPTHRRPFNISNFRVTGAGNQMVGLAWTAPTAGVAPVTHYLIAVNDNWASAVVVDASLTTTTLSGLTNGATYRFSIVAVNAGGESNPAHLDNITIPA